MNISSHHEQQQLPWASAAVMDNSGHHGQQPPWTAATRTPIELANQQPWIWTPNSICLSVFYVLQVFCTMNIVDVVACLAVGREAVVGFFYRRWSDVSVKPYNSTASGVIWIRGPQCHLSMVVSLQWLSWSKSSLVHYLTMKRELRQKLTSPQRSDAFSQSHGRVKFIKLDAYNKLIAWMSSMIKHRGL